MMTNSEWTKTYNDEYVSGFSDLLLVLNNASSRVIVSSNWTFAFEMSPSESCDWESAYDLRQMSIPTILNKSDSTLIPAGLDFYKVIYPINDSSQYNLDVQRLWPKFDEVRVPDRYHSQLSLCKGTGWLARPTHTSFHVNYAFARVRPYASKVQIGLPFLAVVILSNMVKIVGIFLTIRTCSSGHIFTVGDAVATFLGNPEVITKGKCMLSQRELSKQCETPRPQPWHVKKKQILSTLGGKRAWTSANFMVSMILATIFLTLALMRSGMPIEWGTASELILPAIVTSFDARGAMLVAWLANLPQARQLYLEGTGDPSMHVDRSAWHHVFLLADAQVLQDLDIHLLKVAAADYYAVAAVPKNRRSGSRRYLGWIPCQRQPFWTYTANWTRS
ncbi:hypothetical protein C7974DRAFT_53732 [Boeremia exigua]|uniref:uncharacterized protein n=1 Tax=Boeremia exigua TaxID=749465 RepID=UPI001E8CA941|nr:uncharacterized protein C7974DRAFT_53732 [Boeremia exigua]KAH6616882.1 hypothetical protein C7974DRAFT_53732 [Boeremia exigua]